MGAVHYICRWKSAFSLKNPFWHHNGANKRLLPNVGFIKKLKLHSHSIHALYSIFLHLNKLFCIKNCISLLNDHVKKSNKNGGAKLLPRHAHHSQGGMKFATQISPLNN